MNSNERRILVVTCFGHFLSHYNTVVFPALVLPLTQILNLSMTDVLGLSFWMYLLFGISALPWGVLGDRIGGQLLMILMFLGSGVSGIACAYFMEWPAALSLALAGVGLFSGIYHPIGIGLISTGVSRVSLGMGYNAAFGGLGLVVAPLLTGLITWLSGPKAAFIVMGLMNLVGIGLMAKLPLKRPEAVHQQAPEENNGAIGAFATLMVVTMLGGIAFMGSTVILPTYLELKGQGMLQAVSGSLGIHLSGNLFATAVTSVIYVVGMLGQYVGGHVGDRFENRYAYLTFHAICVPAAFLMAISQNLALVALAFVYFFFQLGMQAIENTLVGKLSPRRFRHSAFGLKFVCTFGVGSLAVKLIQAADARWGVEATFITLGSVILLLVMCILLLIYQTSAYQGLFKVRREEAYLGT